MFQIDRHDVVQRSYALTLLSALSRVKDHNEFEEELYAVAALVMDSTEAALVMDSTEQEVLKTLYEDVKDVYIQNVLRRTDDEEKTKKA